MKDNYDFSQGKRGAVQPIPSHQTKLTILIDNDLLEWFGEQVEQSEGGDYLTLINDALREYVDKSKHQSKQKEIKSA
ncbi:MAG: BrnA antitoxin family protein [Crocosphaera sp.]|nr:BrnA antitoxin family protein [Crocosphaera sp.]